MTAWKPIPRLVQFDDDSTIVMGAEAQALFADGQDTRATLLDHADRHSNPQADFRQAIGTVASTTNINHAGDFAFREGVQGKLKSR